jgi:YbbR domain-containing protein
MAWREFFTYNRWQKLFSLGLAVLIWFTVNAGLRRSRDMDPEVPRRTFHDVPVSVLTRTAQEARFRLVPEKVDVVIEGDAEVLAKLSAAELEVYVNLMDMQGTNAGHRRVHVRAPGVRFAESSPEQILIEAGH